MGGAPGEETPQKLELACRHTRIWQAETCTAGKLLAASAARGVAGVNQALITAKFRSRKLLPSLRVLALVCNLVHNLFSSLHRCWWAPASLIVQLRVLPTKKSCTATNAAQRSNVHSMRGAGAAASTQPSRPRDSESIAPPNHRSRISRRAANKWRTHRHEAASVRQARCNGCGAGPCL